jgi:predicted RNA binding protein YcfA (HicA-like mRNA interferase family)
MAHLPQIKPNKLIKIILKEGFIKVRQSGSHVILKHPDGRFTTVPNHRKTIGKGLLRKILKDTNKI